MLTLGHLLQRSETRLSRSWDMPLCRTLARALASSLLNHSLAWIATHGSTPVSARFLRSYTLREARLLKREPLAYILGEAPFLNETFLVSRSTLIPRIETEELVEHVLAAWPRDARDTLALDIGTGSGCIAISLALARGAKHVLASDRSKRALAIALKNAKNILHEQKETLLLRHASLFDRALQKIVLAHAPRRLIVLANLPYLPLGDQQKLAHTSTRFEPTKALFAEDDGLALIKKLLLQVKRFSTQHPTLRIELWLEFDPSSKERLEAWLKDMLPSQECSFLRDAFERWRFVYVR